MSLQKNEAQEEAIKTIKGPVIVISCPGSVKLQLWSDGLNISLTMEEILKRF